MVDDRINRIKESIAKKRMIDRNFMGTTYQNNKKQELNRNYLINNDIYETYANQVLTKLSSKFDNLFEDNDFVKISEIYIKNVSDLLHNSCTNPNDGINIHYKSKDRYKIFCRELGTLDNDRFDYIVFDSFNREVSPSLYDVEEGINGFFIVIKNPTPSTRVLLTDDSYVNICRIADKNKSKKNYLNIKRDENYKYYIVQNHNNVLGVSSSDDIVVNYIDDNNVVKRLDVDVSYNHYNHKIKITDNNRVYPDEIYVINRNHSIDRTYVFNNSECLKGAIHGDDELYHEEIDINEFRIRLFTIENMKYIPFSIGDIEKYTPLLFINGYKMFKGRDYDFEEVSGHIFIHIYFVPPERFVTIRMYINGYISNVQTLYKGTSIGETNNFKVIPEINTLNFSDYFINFFLSSSLMFQGRFFMNPKVVIDNRYPNILIFNPLDINTDYIEVYQYVNLVNMIKSGFEQVVYEYGQLLKTITSSEEYITAFEEGNELVTVDTYMSELIDYYPKTIYPLTEWVNEFFNYNVGDDGTITITSNKSHMDIFIDINDSYVEEDVEIIPNMDRELCPSIIFPRN